MPTANDAGQQQVHVSYDKTHNTVYIGAPESAFVPKYLDYILEYLHIPKTAKRIFLINNKGGQ